MDVSSFFLSPLGWVFITVLLLVAVFSFRAASLAMQQRSAVYHALLASAKKRAQQKVSIIIPLHRRAESLAPLFEQLAIQAYSKLEIVVIVYHTAGKSAVLESQKLAMLHGLKLVTIKHIKGLSLEEAVRQKASGQLIMLGQAGARFSPRFFEKVSFAFARSIQATHIRQLSRVERTLISVFWAAISTLHQLATSIFSRATHHTGLTENVIARKDVILSGAKYAARAELYDEYAVMVPRRKSMPTWRALVAFIIVATCITILLGTAPLDLLTYVGVLIFSVLFITTEITLLQQTGLTRNDKSALFFIVPFLPFFAIVALAVRSVVYIGVTLSHLAQRQLARKKRPMRQGRTQAKRLSISSLLGRE